MYNDRNISSAPRYSTPCRKLRNQIKTHHDPKDFNAGEIISLASYLGIDKRGDAKLSAF